MTKPTDEATTVDRLRADIDAGRTGDKVAASDPAAAPLGADEEAAGTPLSPNEITLARQEELKPAHDRRGGYVRPVVAALTLSIGFAGVALLLIGALP